MKKIVSCFLALVLVLILAPCALAAEPFIQDRAGILSESERQVLEEQAQTISSTYDCDVYVVTVPEYLSSGKSMQEFAEHYYRDHDLGKGSDRNGIQLMLSMEERQFWLLGFGPVSFTALTDYGQDEMIQQFLDDFGDDDWYDGFRDYLDQAHFYLETAAEGKPFDVGYQDGGNAAASYGIGFGVSVVVAIIVGAVLLVQMKTAKQQISASAYIPSDGVEFTNRTDLFTHVTTQRAKIQTDTGSSGSSGGTTVHSSGFSGKGGSF